MTKTYNFVNAAFGKTYEAGKYKKENNSYETLNRCLYGIRLEGKLKPITQVIET
jgi:hypothetical protein